SLGSAAIGLTRLDAVRIDRAVLVAGLRVLLVAELARVRVLVVELVAGIDRRAITRLRRPHGRCRASRWNTSRDLPGAGMFRQALLRGVVTVGPGELRLRVGPGVGVGVGGSGVVLVGGEICRHIGGRAATDRTGLVVGIGGAGGGSAGATAADGALAPRPFFG